MRLLAPALAALLALAPAAAPAALPVGAQAPDFITSGALAGQPFRLRLREQLRRGPVVLYFYPRAFTQGCTLEAHAFSEAAMDFRRAGARVIGMSADDYDALRRFSVEGCRSAFPVATATPDTIHAYDVRLRDGAPMTNRTSYVIAPDGRIIYAFTDMDYRNHVANTLAAVRDWNAHHRRGR
ncbi:MAG: peroxiredoxin [Sphingomonadaceae bacterium]|nr:peroxiredoxin [Sphingomonadaceae bacterium]